MLDMRLADPAALAPQADTPADAADRRALKLSLVIDGERGVRRYDIDADQAWAYFNDAYDLASGACECLDGTDTVYYEVTP